MIFGNLVTANQTYDFLPPFAPRKCICYEALQISKQLRQEGIEVLEKSNILICVELVRATKGMRVYGFSKTKYWSCFS